MWTHSVRFQLTGWYLTTLAVILVAAGGLLYLGLRAALLRETDDGLAAKAAQVSRLLTAPPDDDPDERQQDPRAIIRQSAPPLALPGVPHETLLLRLASEDTGQTVAVSPELAAQANLLAALAALPAPRQARPALAFAASTEEDQVRCLTIAVPRTRYRLQVATPWDSVEDLLARLLGGIALAGLLFLALSGIGSWLLVSRTLKPIDAIATEAELLTTERLAATPNLRLLPRTVSDNEIGHLLRSLDRMLSRLGEAFAAQRRFTADASHELRTPLTILQGEFELMLTRPRPEDEYRRALESGLEEIRRMSRIVESLALLARGDAAPPSVPLAPVSLAELAQEGAATFAEPCVQKGLKISIQQGSGSAIVCGDADTLRRLLRNLIENAVRCTPPGGEVTLSVQESEDTCELRVADTGIGISLDDLPHIFTRFYRADKARGNDGGSGLGLSIAQSIAQAHGGQIAAVSQPGQGSVFTVTMPKGKNILT